MDCYSQLREKRAEILKAFDPMIILLRPDEQQDVIDGKCILTSYLCTPILDYTRRPWFAKPETEEDN